MKHFLYISFALIICIGLLWACKPGQEKVVDKPEGKKDIPSVETSGAQKTIISKTASLTGSVIATRIARVATSVEGPIIRARIKEGDNIRKGEVVFSVGRSTSADASLASAKEDLKRDKEEMGRIDKLVQSGAIPGVELDKSRANVARAEAQVAKAQETINDYTLHSPWNGSVSKVLVAEGDYVAPRAVLAEIYDPTSLVIQCSFPEALTRYATTGTTVLATLDAYPDRTFNARVSRVYSEMERRTRTLTVEVSLNDRVSLVPGMFARLKVILEKASDATVVPVEALFETPKGSRGLYVVKEGKALLREVETGIEEGNRIQILKGIAPGDQVVVVGQEKLKDGVAVRVAGVEKSSPLQDKKGEAKK
jgi:membrane fusion protein (multidrug efflux system)